MVDIIIYQGQHVVRIALAVAIDSSRGVCCVIGWVGIVEVEGGVVGEFEGGGDEVES